MKELEKIKIKDISIHPKGDKERKPNVIEVEVGRIKYKVHRHIYYPGTWLLSCRELGIEQENMKTDDLEEALHNARVYMMGALDGFIDKLDIARKRLEESGEMSL
nr:hypothetical protein [uncultured Sellimonas sp.]